MKKIILTLCLIISILINIQAQRNDNGINGTFTFRNATVSAVNYQSGAQVYSQEINDSAQLATQEFFFPIPIPIFKTAEINNGQIVSCTLLNNGKQYIIEDSRLLSIDSKEENRDNSLPKDEFTEDYVLNPTSISAHGNEVTVTVDGYIYGSSAFPGQTLRGKYTVMMQKQ